MISLSYDSTENERISTKSITDRSIVARNVLTQLLIIALLAITNITAFLTEGGLLVVSDLSGGDAESPSSTTQSPLGIEAQPKRDEYTYVPGVGGYKVHTRAVPWVEAREVCRDEGGHLAIMNSFNESQTMASIFKSLPAITGSEYPEYVSIGFHDLHREGEYITINDESLAKAGFDQWESGQPNNYDNQDCGGMSGNGLLDDFHCHADLAFMCEKPEQQPDQS